MMKFNIYYNMNRLKKAKVNGAHQAYSYRFVKYIRNENKVTKRDTYIILCVKD